MSVHPFIEAEKQAGHSVKRACELLKVSRAAFLPPHRRRRPTSRAGRGADRADHRRPCPAPRHLRGPAHPRRPQAREHARTAVFEWIEGWYNLHRLHSSFGWPLDGLLLFSELGVTASVPDLRELLEAGCLVGGDGAGIGARGADDRARRAQLLE